MKLIIVEDEANSREMMRMMVEMTAPELSIEGLAESVPQAVALIKAAQPDIILLDIELHPDKCFDIFPQLDHLDFEVIFTTAYKNYAIDAIKYGALDYLLKPIDMDELHAALQKAKRKRSQSKQNLALHTLVEGLKPAATNGPKRIGLATSDGIIYAEVAQMLRCEARGAYTNIYFKDGKRITTSKNLKEYELLLSGRQFQRVHNSHLVNLAEVRKYVKTDGGYLEMTDGSEVPVSAGHKDAFLERMRGM